MQRYEHFFIYASNFRNFFRKFVLIDINQEIINFSFELNNFNIKNLFISKIIIRAYIIYVKYNCKEKRICPILKSLTQITGLQDFVYP